MAPEAPIHAIAGRTNHFPLTFQCRVAEERLRIKVTGDKVLEQLRGIGGRILHTSLDHTREERLRKALAGEVDAATS